MTCPICQSPITTKNAHGKWRVTCSERCRHKLGSPKEATAARKRACAERINASLRFYFGNLSERDLAIVRFVWKHAYQRALHRSYRAQRKAAA